MSTTRSDGVLTAVDRVSRRLGPLTRVIDGIATRAIPSTPVTACDPSGFVLCDCYCVPPLCYTEPPATYTRYHYASTEEDCLFGNWNECDICSCYGGTPLPPC